jgi:hypothetical protein
MSVVIPQGGASANVSGQLGEDLVRSRLVAKGYNEVDAADRKRIVTACNAGADVTLMLRPGTFYTQIPAFKSIYGLPFKADFIVSPHVEGKPILFEMKFQSSNGSVDEKLPFWLLSLEALARKVQPVLVILGDGARKGAISWCHDYKGAVHVLSSAKTLNAYVAGIR